MRNSTGIQRALVLASSESERQRIAAGLSSRGVESDDAADLKDALKRVAFRSYDIIVVDPQFPPTSLQALRDLSRDVPILGLDDLGGEGQARLPIAKRTR